jgi:hypothetical protein
MRTPAAGVAERVQPPALGAHHECALAGRIPAQVVAGDAQLRLVSQHLPCRAQQPLALKRKQRLVPVGARRQPVGACDSDAGDGRGAAEITEPPGKYRVQVAQRARHGAGAVDVSLALESDSLPQHLEHADEPERHRIGVEMARAAHRDHALHELAHERRELLVLLATDVLVLLARACFAPECVPDRHLARARNLRIEVEIHQQPQRLHRVVLQPRDGYEHTLAELRGQVLERCHQHRGLGVEVEAHDPWREVGERHDLLHRGARWAVDVQRGDAGIDQTLPLALADARATTRGVLAHRRTLARHLTHCISSRRARWRQSLYGAQVYRAQYSAGTVST